LFVLIGVGAFCLIPATYQNSIVLVSIGNLNLSQNGVVLIFILIFFSPIGHFSNLTLPKRRSFDLSIQFDGND
jgi:hypothetical protein